MTIKISKRYDLFSPEDKLGKKHQGSSKSCRVNTRRFQQVIEVNNPRPTHEHNSPKNTLIELL